MTKLFTLLFFFISVSGNAQSNPAINHWIINTTGATGFAGIPTNVQQVQYSTNNVYVTTTDIADWIPVGYDWPNNPWFPENQNYVFKITLHPQQNTGTLVKPPYGHIGLWTNGVSIYNPKDAKSWQDSSKWFQNAIYFEHEEMETMDSCLGHPNGNHEYHLHVHPKCLYNSYDSTRHSPIIGFAFDGFPIYGSYTYENTNGTGNIKRMKSSYQLRNITDRTVLPGGTVLAPIYYGPSLAQYPLGAYVDDFEYVQGWGDLDEHNGRFCVTPEYPQGTYAYFVTLDSLLEPAYPYVLGETYYGTVQPGNLGPNSGHVSITETVNVYTSVNDVENKIIFLLYPNPAKNVLNLFLIPSYNSNFIASLYDVTGRKLKAIENIQTAVNYSFDVSDLLNGPYTLVLENGTQKVSSKVMIAR